jgi:hypothetical protein
MNSKVENSQVEASITHLAGARLDKLGPMNIAAVCLVRDGAYYVHEFVRYHLGLGVNHIVFLDNGSLDGTAELAAATSTSVTVLRCTLPFRSWETSMKRQLVNIVGRVSQWILLLDIDEFFYVPNVKCAGGLMSLIQYLDNNKYSAVITHMLDLFPRSIDFENRDPFDRSEHCYADLSSITRQPYDEFVRVGKNMITVPNHNKLEFLTNGFRWSFFALRRPLWITKHALTRPSAGVYVSDPHLVQRANVADVSFILLHYQFTPRLLDKVMSAVHDRRYGWSAHEEYTKYAQRLEGNSEIILAGATAQRIHRLDQFIETQLLMTPR